MVHIHKQYGLNDLNEVAFVCEHVATEEKVSSHLGGKPKFWRAFSKLEYSLECIFLVAKDAERTALLINLSTHERKA